MRTKSTIINFITDAFPQVLILLLGLFKTKFFIQILGESQLGLYQLYGQIIAYLVLVEGGVGSALLFRLYKPLNKKDTQKINEIMAAGRIIFRIIAVLILILGFILSFFIEFFINDSSFSFSYMQITFLLYLVSQAIYYFAIPHRVLFEADQKKYVPNLIFQITAIVKAILEIIIVCCGLGLMAVLVSLVVCSIVANCILLITYRKYYSEIDFKGKKDFSMLKDVKDLFINTLGILVTNNIDILIISKVIGLGQVVIYSTYNYFVEGIKQFIDKISSSVMSGVGDLLVENKEKAIGVFNEFNEFVFFVASVISVPMFIFINKFIDIWYKGNVTTNVVWAVLFTIILFYQITKIPLKVFTYSSGQFKDVKIFVVFEVIINLSLSLILVKSMGISGVLIATIISMFLADWCTKPIVIFKKIFNANVWKYYAKYIINTLFIVLSCVIFYLIIPKNYSNLLVCLMLGFVVSLINFIIMAIYYFITKQYKFIYRFNIFNLKKKAISE
ncbi:MAG: lipopolysaccharide biosynthesis protein [Clostridia bacterium]